MLLVDKVDAHGQIVAPLNLGHPALLLSLFLVMIESIVATTIIDDNAHPGVCQEMKDRLKDAANSGKKRDRQDCRRPLSTSR
jgi:hypothetical protein